jgi:hypothetical protein
LKEAISTAQQKWPDASLDFMEVFSYDPAEFQLTIRKAPPVEFWPDDQLTIHPSITLGALSRIITRQPATCDLEKVQLCWNNGLLHLTLLP